MSMQTYHSPLTGAALLLTLSSCLTGPPVYHSPRAHSVHLAAEAGPPMARHEQAAPSSDRPTLSVLTFIDDRPAFHKEARPAHWREDGGFTGEAPTRESAWARPLPLLAADDLAARLAASGRFGAVDRAGSLDEARGELILRARLRRLRGFQGYHLARGGPPTLIVNLGEVFLDAVEIVPRAGGAPRFVGQAGARVDEAEALDPFALAQAAWAEAAAGLVDRIVADPLTQPRARALSLPPGAHGDLTALLGALPGAWQVDDAAPAAAPPGWTGAGDCRALAFVDPTRTFFQPQLGHYRPGLRLWLCPPEVHLSLKLGAKGPRFPAELVGSVKGAPLLLLSLGKSSWPGARQEVLRFLGATPLEGPVLRWPTR